MVNQDVGWLHIAVDDSNVVTRLQRFRQNTTPTNDTLGGQTTLPLGLFDDLSQT